MDIEGLGEERVHQFVEAGLLTDAADIYSSPSSSSCARAHRRAVGRSCSSTRSTASQARPLAKLLVGLGIRHVGPDRGRRRSRASSAASTRIAGADARSSPRSTASGRSSPRASPVLRHRAQPRAGREAARRGRELRRAPSRSRCRPTGRRSRASRSCSPARSSDDARGGAGGDRGARRQGHEQRVEEDELRGRGREPGFEAREGRAARRDRSSTRTARDLLEHGPESAEAETAT